MVVRLAIFADGTIDTPRVTVSSGRQSYDKHALDAIYQAAPFAPLPSGIGKALPICMTFSYNQGQDKWQKPIDLWPNHPARSEAPPPSS